MSLLELHTPAVGTTGDIHQALCVVKSDPRKQKLRLLRLQETAIVALTEQRYQVSEKRVCVFVVHKRAEETYVHNIINAQVFLREWLECVVCDEMYVLRTPGFRWILPWRFVEAIDPC